MKSLIVLYSYHHHNTRKVAEAMAGAIGATIKSPSEIKENEPLRYDLVGFGAGIDSGMHYRELLDFAEKLPPVNGNKCFIFSTSAVLTVKKTEKDHARLRGILLSKGYRVIGEFSCLGFNTNHFLKYLGGMNKGRPNAEDIENARRFAENLEA
jgi:flavodoxin